MNPHPIEQALIDAGYPGLQAGILANAFPAEPVAEFMAGLDQIAEAVANQVKPSLVPSAAEPWRTIHGHMLANGKSPDDAYEDSLGLWPNAVQFAIAAVVSLRLADILKAADAAIGGKRQRFKTADYMTALHSLGYQFRMNDVSDGVEVNGCPITDTVAAEIRTRMRDLGFDFINVMEDAYLTEAHHQRYHPVKDYLRGLQWDGQPHIETLASYVVDRYQVFDLWLRKWLIGAVAKVLAGKQNPVLVLDGGQGLGKSLLAQWLGSGLPAYFTESSINLDDKDTYIRLMTKWVWEAAEFGQTMRKYDREALKNFITLGHVTVRKPYGHFDLTKPAMASMIGTVNNEVGILDDPTGSRRYLVTHIDKIDWNYTQLDVNQVWAEAHAAFLAGEQFSLTPAEAQRAAEINEQYEVEDPVEGLLLKFFKVDSHNPLLWTPSQEILSTLETGGLKGTTQANSKALAITMKRMRCEKKKSRLANGQMVQGYVGVVVL